MREARTALIIGAGGLGCPIALGLAEAGIERLVLLDDDVVEASNLHRQVLYTSADVGRLKVEAAVERLADRAPGIEVVALKARLTAENALALIREHAASVVIDATDDPTAGFAINDAALRLGVPAVLGGVIRFEGIVMGVRPGAACFRCLFETPPKRDAVPTCASAGVLGAMAGVVGHLQVQRALTLLGHAPDDATGFVTTLDGLAGRIRDVPVPHDPYCTCAHQPGDAIQGSAPMNVSVRLPTSLRRYAGGQHTVRVTSCNVREAIDELDSSHPGIKAKLVDGAGNLRRFINVYADREDIRFLDNLDTTLSDGTELQIVPATAGGR